MSQNRDAEEEENEEEEERELQDIMTHENQKKIKQIFKDNKKNPYLYNDVNTALDWKHSNPLVVTVKNSIDDNEERKNFVLNAGEHECCFHFIKNDIVTRCKLTNKLVGIDMDFYRSCNPDGQTAKLIDYYHSAGNIPREFMFRRQYFCWTHLSLLTGVRPKIVHSEKPDGNLETKLFAVSMIPADTVFACFCNYRASQNKMQTVFQPTEGIIHDIPNVANIPYAVGNNESFYFNLFFRDIADYAVADSSDESKNYNAILDNYKLVIEKADQNTNEIQYIKVDDKDKTEQKDFIGDIWALKSNQDIYGGYGEENHVEIKYHATKVQMENIRLQYYGNEVNIPGGDEGETMKIKNTVLNLDELIEDSDLADIVHDHRAPRETGNDEEKEVIDEDSFSKCPFVFLLFCRDTLLRLQQVLTDTENNVPYTDEEKIDLFNELITYKEPNLEIIFFLQKEGVSENNINFLKKLFNPYLFTEKYEFESILNTVTPDEYRSLKHNFLNVYPEHNYKFNYILNKEFKTCGSIIKYFRLAQNYYTPEQVTNTLKSFFTFYKEAVLKKINENAEESFKKKQYNENIDMITHVAFSEMPYFKNFREELNIVQLASSANASPASQASPPSPPSPPPSPSSSLPATTTPTTTTTTSPVTATSPTVTTTATSATTTTSPAAPTATTTTSPAAPIATTTVTTTATTTAPATTTTTPATSPQPPPQSTTTTTTTTTTSPVSPDVTPTTVTVTATTPSPPSQPTTDVPTITSPLSSPIPATVPNTSPLATQPPVVTVEPVVDGGTAVVLAINDFHHVDFLDEARNFRFDAVPGVPYTNITQNCPIPIPGQLAIIDSCTEDMWRQNYNDCFLDSFLFATFATKKVSDIFNKILVAIRNNYKPLYDVFVGYLDLHGKPLDNNYRLCKQKYKNSIYNCLFEISTAYRNDLSHDRTIYNNKLNDRLKEDLNQAMLLRMLPTELSIIPENERSLQDLSSSNLDSLLYFFELVTLLFPEINTKIYYKYSSDSTHRPLKPFFDTNYYDCIIYLEKEETFTKSFSTIESEFNENISNNYEINSIIVPCGSHVVAFNTEMCSGKKTYFFYDNQRQKIEIRANAILNDILKNILCLNATIIATKKTTQQ